MPTRSILFFLGALGCQAVFFLAMKRSPRRLGIGLAAFGGFLGLIAAALWAN